MTGALDSTMRALATSLIGEFGKSISFVSVTLGAYNEDTSIAAKTETSYTVTAIIEPAKPRRFDDQTDAADTKVTVAAADLSVSPKRGDVLIIDSVRSRIIEPIPVFSGAQAALWELWVRRA